MSFQGVKDVREIETGSGFVEICWSAFARVRLNDVGTHYSVRTTLQVGSGHCFQICRLELA